MKKFNNTKEWASICEPSHVRRWKKSKANQLGGDWPWDLSYLQVHRCTSSCGHATLKRRLFFLKEKVQPEAHDIEVSEEVSFLDLPGRLLNLLVQHLLQFQPCLDPETSFSDVGLVGTTVQEGALTVRFLGKKY